jgi:SPP1 family predicted phage head-tail adaptor
VKAATHDPGWLRHRVTIEVATETGDDAGGASRSWATFATLWARIEPVSAGEKTIAAHLAGVVTHKVTLRWRDDLTASMRIGYRGRHFRIRMIHDPDEGRRYLELGCEEEGT